VSMFGPIKNSGLRLLEQANQWSCILVMCRSSERGAKVLVLRWRVEVSRNSASKSALATLNRGSAGVKDHDHGALLTRLGLKYTCN
jgi:hypothetical protein